MHIFLKSLWNNTSIFEWVSFQNAKVQRWKWSSLSSECL
jgi:hypothetical protein